MPKGDLLKAVVSGILVVGILSFLTVAGIGAVSNNNKDHKIIRKDITSIYIELKDDVNDIKIEQAVQGEILRRIDNKT